MATVEAPQTLQDLIAECTEQGLTAEQTAERIEMFQAEERAMKRASRKTNSDEPKELWSRAPGRVFDGLAYDVTGSMSSREALKKSGQDFLASKVQLYAPRTTGEPIPIHGHFANIREDTGDVLGLVSEKYQLLQNHEVYSIMDEMAGIAGLRYETAGSLRGGKRVWMLARMPEATFAVGSDDEVRPYLLGTNGFDSTMAFRLLPTSVRVVCENTLAMALREGRGRGMSWNHVGDMEAKKDAAKEMLGIARDHFNNFATGAKLLASHEINEQIAQAYFEELFPERDPEAVGIGAGEYWRDKSKRQASRVAPERARLMELFETGVGTDLPGVRGTAWAAYNAITEHLDHDRPNRNNTRDRRSSHQLESVLFGPGRSLKARAFDLGMKLAQGQWEPVSNRVTVPVASHEPKAKRTRRKASD